MIIFTGNSDADRMYELLQEVKETVDKNRENDIKVEVKISVFLYKFALNSNCCHNRLVFRNF